MLNRVRLKTWFVDGRREARTVLAIRAAFVDREAGNLKRIVSVLLLLYVNDGFSLRFWPGTVVECEDIDAHEPATECPDAVNAG